MTSCHMVMTNGAFKSPGEYGVVHLLHHLRKSVIFPFCRDLNSLHLGEHRHRVI